MTIDQTITHAMELSETVAGNVLSHRTNRAAIEAAEQLLAVLRTQAEMIEERGNVVSFHA